MSNPKNNYTRNFIIVVSCLLFVSIVFLLLKYYTAINYDTTAISNIRTLNNMIDSLKTENDFLQVELDAYKHSPAKVLANIRQSYEEKKYLDIKDSLEFLQKYHPETRECVEAQKIYKQALKDLEAERKKMEEIKRKEEAKMEETRRKEEAKKMPEDRIMEEFGCSQDMAKNIRKGVVQIGMTQEMVIAAWGRPISTQSMGGHYGVFEEWRYANRILIFKDGKLWRVPKKSDDMKFIFIQ